MKQMKFARAQLLPKDFYVDARAIFEKPIENRYKWFCNRVKTLCNKCFYAEWNHIQIVHEYRSKLQWNPKTGLMDFKPLILEEFMACYCHKKFQNKNRIVKRCKHYCDNVLPFSCVEPIENMNKLKEILEKMPKILDVPPNIDKTLISREGTKVKITKATIEKNIYTSIGSIPKGIVIQVAYGNDNELEGVQMWSIPTDRPLAGSASRVIRAFLPEINDTDKLTNEVLKKLVDKEVLVKNRGDKLYWSVPESLNPKPKG